MALTRLNGYLEPKVTGESVCHPWPFVFSAFRNHSKSSRSLEPCVQNSSAQFRDSDRNYLNYLNQFNQASAINLGAPNRPLICEEVTMGSSERSRPKRADNSESPVFAILMQITFCLTPEVRASDTLFGWINLFGLFRSESVVLRAKLSVTSCVRVLFRVLAATQTSQQTPARVRCVPWRSLAQAADKSTTWNLLFAPHIVVSVARPQHGFRQSLAGNRIEFSLPLLRSRTGYQTQTKRSRRVIPRTWTADPCAAPPTVRKSRGSRSALIGCIRWDRCPIKTQRNAIIIIKMPFY